MKDRLLEVANLRVAVGPPSERVLATRDVNFVLQPRQRLGIVGESGSGKTTTALAVIGLLPHDAAILAGSITYRGEQLLGLPERRLKEYRGREIAMVFQGASTALNPLIRVGDQISDVVQAYDRLSRRQAWHRAVGLLASMGLPHPERNARGYPHEYSGGMAQRALIAMALACRPQVLIADEPTTGLDPIVQAQVLDKIVEQVGEQGTSLILISHDIDVIRRACTGVVVMYAGQVMETGEADQALRRPQHPYSRALLRAAEPRDDGRFSFIPGRVPALEASFGGCAFYDRCWLAEQLDRPAKCVEQQPNLQTGPSGSLVACHFVGAERDA